MGQFIHDIFAEWNITSFLTTLCHDDALEIPLECFSFDNVKQWCDVNGRFDDSCRIFINKNILDNGKRIRLATIGNLTDGQPAANITVIMLKVADEVRINIGGSHVNVFVGRFGYAFSSILNLWDNSTLCVGDGATANGIRAVAHNSEIIIGKDALISDEILIQGNDQHGIVDLKENKIINNTRRHVHIGQHVWLGRRSTIMPDVRLGDGCIVGTGAVVTQDVEPCSIVVGVPARVIRRGVTWSRNPEYIGQDELAFLRPDGQG